MNPMIWIIIFGGIATYGTRIGGHLVLSRFDHIHPRVQAGLNAVPAAVLTTLVAPALIDAGPAEWVAIVFAAFVGLRAKLTGMFFSSAVLLIALRQIGFS
ncbi:AzlD family protein [Notoacmeibacter ruber]|uniref:AzlD family protein n=1 Tax=Notoacmeibacter ruber TaxID=2670375 RepID=A0A3L7JI52_9HYPH|nr:AzlD family protein [Notoacmeibacter ruber]RLQ88172.1 AzlD family protein [Notoacmeibacter ruber]